MKEWYNSFNVRTLSKTNLKWTKWVLFVLAFVDASFFPLPVSTTFLLFILLDSTRSVRYIIFIILGTLTGSVAGYLIGHFVLLNADGSLSGFLQFLFNHIPGFSENAYSGMQALYSKWGFWILFTASFTPVPYALFSLSAGASNFSFLIFCFVTLLSQLLKYYLLAFVIIKIGPKVRMMFKLNLKPILVIASVCIAIALLVTGII
jgi:membrane protein YqaA with SNARE-associated domain